MPRRTRLTAPRWPLAIAAAYAAGVWLAAWSLIASAHWLMTTSVPLRPLGLPGPTWTPWLALLPALAGACGFAFGWHVFGPRGRSTPHGRACGAALAAGCLFPWLSGALLPLLAAARAGAWPALLWCVLGSALMVVPVSRATRTLKKGNP
jgi:hypothetical protein